MLSNTDIYASAANRREFVEFVHSLRGVTQDDMECLRVLAEMLTPMLQYLADGYHGETMGQRAFVLVYALRPDLVGGHSLTEAGKKLGVSRQAMQYQLESLRQELPALSINTESRQGKESDRTRRSERARILRANGKELRLTRFARRRAFV